MLLMVFNSIKMKGTFDIIIPDHRGNFKFFVKLKEQENLQDL